MSASAGINAVQVSVIQMNRSILTDRLKSFEEEQGQQRINLTNLSDNSKCISSELRLCSLQYARLQVRTITATLILVLIFYSTVASL